MRKERNLSQEDFADATQLDRTYVSGLERGVRNPSYLTLLKIAKALHITLKELFWENG
nr:helix-turn-helix transcriptional regulator [Fibrobacter sp. NR9]